MDEKKIRPQDRWDAKAGVAAKSYKVDRKTADEFKETCKRLGISMGPQLTKMMREFIEQNKETE
ncbi:hypothetical protein CXIVA_01870 [Clostridium sp. SY8519]|jgi:hypothetical protein|uniref:hypothetical protein n=1 Tax=Clostridium sp. (strain SY8519) TaxID=1042156 RepID=UPI0002171F81|nr:hypothetical protein [Clostridium sp. SY8519]BAK46154.1 hypothetical protein CXIVA_01870 [Clostridium sp. SY8519]